MPRQVKRNRVDAMPQTTARAAMRRPGVAPEIQDEEGIQDAVPGVSIDTPDESQADTYVPPSGRTRRRAAQGIPQEDISLPRVSVHGTPLGRPVGVFLQPVRDKTGERRGSYQRAPEGIAVQPGVGLDEFLFELNKAIDYAKGIENFARAMGIPRRSVYRWRRGNLPPTKKLSVLFYQFKAFTAPVKQ